MKLKGFQLPGKRDVNISVDPRTALHIWFHLHASMHSEETTRASRIVVSAFLASLGRAIHETGFVAQRTLDDMAKHMQSKPAPPPLDDTIAALADEMTRGR